MTNRRNHRAALILLPLLFGVAGPIGCAGKQQRVSDAPPTELTLAYRVPTDRSLRYRTTFEQTHGMELRGQVRSFVFSKALAFSMRSEGSGGDTENLTITVESLEVKLDTPRGLTQKRVPEVEGKSFGMVVSPLGEELSFSGTGAVLYDLPPAGTQNVQIEFEAFFPDLAGRPLSVGDQWETENRITDTAFNSGKKIRLQTVHTLEGFETIDGMDCAKITSVIRGALDESSERITRAPEMSASFEGFAVAYLAYEKGFLVRTTTTLRGSGVAATGGGTGPPRGMRQEMKTITRLLPL